MTTSNRVIINLSKKKVGTSFVFQLFRHNFSLRNSAEIFVPGLKEYYFFPRKTENYYRLPERIIEFVDTKKEKFNKDDLVFMLSILAFETTGFTEKYFKFKGGKNIELCFNRFHYLHRYATKSHKSIYISDTNFQNYILNDNSNLQRFVINNLNKNFERTKFFCVIRDPKKSIISLLKTEPEQLKTHSEDTIKHHIARYNQFEQLKKLLVNCNPLISSILLLDFDYITNDTTNAFIVKEDFLELATNGKFVIPENPNPSKELSKENQDELSQWIPLIDEQINQQIDASDYRRLSEEKFAVLKLKK